MARLNMALGIIESSMTHVLIFILLLGGAVAFYHLWGITYAVAFLLLGVFFEGAAYWWVGRSEDEGGSK
jgi:hypothetical protein